MQEQLAFEACRFPFATMQPGRSQAACTALNTSPRNAKQSSAFIGITSVTTPPTNPSTDDAAFENASAQNASTENDSVQKPLRLWPGVMAVTLQWLAWL